MAKAKETAAESSGNTVTVSAEEFQEMQQQLKLMSQYLASDNRMKSAAAEKEEAEEKLLQKIREANKRSMEPVKIHVDRGNMRNSRNVEVAINGVQYLVPRGVDVMVPRCVAEVINNAEKQRDNAFAMQEEKSAEFVTAEAQGAFNGGFAVN